MSCSNEALKSRIGSVVQIARTTISSLTEAYGLSDSSRNLKLNENIADARFIDEDGLKGEEDEDDMKLEE